MYFPLTLCARPLLRVLSSRSGISALLGFDARPIVVGIRSSGTGPDVCLSIPGLVDGRPCGVGIELSAVALVLITQRNIMI